MSSGASEGPLENVEPPAPGGASESDGPLENVEPTAPGGPPENDEPSGLANEGPSEPENDEPVPPLLQAWFDQNFPCLAEY